MDDSMNSESRLSVSFGRFENDALSWEKWSSFSPNKYLEEVGNLSTPGSVAQKKAYFEAHYKKILARKAEELEQENSAGTAFLSPDGMIKEDGYENSPEPNIKFILSGGEKVVKEIDFSNEAEDENNSDRPNGFVNVINSYYEKEDFVKCESPKIEEAKDEPSVSVELGGSELNIKKKSVLVVLLETPRKDSKDNVEKRPERKNGRVQQTSVLKKGNSKSSARNITQKVTPIKKDTSSVIITKKKMVSSSLTKPLQADLIRYSKPALTATPLSVSRPLKKKANGSHMPKCNSDPTSLHMSISMGPTNSLRELSMTRKSLIMERMGDKDIVKRAFKTFQNRTNGLKADEKPSTVKHDKDIVKRAFKTFQNRTNGLKADEKPSTVKHVSSTTALKPKFSSFHTPTKGNIEPRKDLVKTAMPSSHTGIKPNPLPSGKTQRSSAPSRKNTMAFAPSATALKSDEKSVKRKEFLKKLEAKSIARETANAQLSVKSMAGVASKIHQELTLSL